MIVQVQVRTVYGVKAVYPMNGEAILFAKIAGTKTLTTDALRHIRALGITVEEVFTPSLEVA